MTRRTYAFLTNEAQRIGASGFPVVLDATFGEREHREQALRAFASVDVPVRIVRCRASEDTLCNRLESREGDISDADTAVLIRQLENFDELNDTERTIAVDLDTDRPINYKKLARAVTQDESTK
jgi:predicted kinase